MNLPIYADNAATTPLSQSAFYAMEKYFSEEYANPSAIYLSGVSAKAALEGARARIADALGALVNEVFFTSGGTESDNWAIFGAAMHSPLKRHIVSTAIEHSAVYEACEHLRESGYEITQLAPERDGTITPEAVEAAIREDTALVSVMMANNEIGTVNDIAAIGRVCRAKKTLFHTDAVATAGHVAYDMRSLGVDMMSLSAHKFGGPKGVGLLYVKVPLILPPILYGGGQEKGRRSGTSNVAGIVGMAKALCDAVDGRAEYVSEVTPLRDRLIEGILQIEGAYLTGSESNRLAGMASFCFEELENAPIIARLSEAGIYASSGSACSAGSGNPSRVLAACGYPEALARAALRFSLSEKNTRPEIEYIIDQTAKIVQALRPKRYY